jgi:uncharacterized membrane protein YidH (DUF202 family)
LTATAAGRPPDWASQPERTSLAWTRTSLGFLANGVLLLLKYLRVDAPPASLLTAGFATAMTLGIYVIGRRRQKLLLRQPLPTHLSPRREVYTVTALVGLLIVVSLMSLLL